MIPFLRAGLERREKCLYLVDENTGQAVLAALRAAGIPVEAARASGALELLTSRDVYLRQGVFAPEAVVDMVAGVIRQVLGDGFSGLRVAGEMSWALGDHLGSERLLEYEALINSFLEQHQCLALIRSWSRQGRFTATLTTFRLRSSSNSASSSGK